MQMTLNIADDVLEAANKIAESENRLVDDVISDLARKSLLQPLRWEVRNGFPLIPRHFGSKPVTNEMINALKEDDY